MAHFARINENNVVDLVVVISNEDLIDDDGNERESLGAKVCRDTVGPGIWVQTSYNHNLRKTFARPGFIYNQDLDIFYNPTPPYPSWEMNENFDFVPPIAPPDINLENYYWDEDNLSWAIIGEPGE